MASEASPTSRNKTELLIDCTDIFKHDEKANNIVAKQVQRKVMRNKLETLDSNFYQSHDAQATPPVIKTQVWSKTINDINKVVILHFYS